MMSVHPTPGQERKIFMSNCAVVGINWGDEGKGRMVDLIARDFDVVVRYQGGNNAGHTVVNEYGSFGLHLIPSGIFSEGVVNVLGNGVVIDPESLWKEMEGLRAAGVRVTPENFKISDRASIVFPYHLQLDGLEEERLKDKKYGSTRRGIAPVYSDKYQKKTIMMGEILHPDYLKARLQGILEWKNLTLTGVYGAEPNEFGRIYDWVMRYGGYLKDYICDTTELLTNAQRQGKNIMFEAQLGALRDIDFGIYPYTSSSYSIAGYACIGAGIPGSHVDRTVGIVKAYSTCVGEGPFTAEWFGPEADALREAADNLQKNTAHVSAMRDRLIENLSKIPHSVLNGDANDRLPGNVNFCFEGIEGESLLLLLDDKGVCASSGSACTSGSLDPSHVLLAIGRPHEIAHGSLRLSLSEENTDEEIDRTIGAVTEVVGYLRNMSPVWRDLVAGKKEFITK